MSIAVALRIARREMRGGLRGFRVFLACLALSIAAIAAIDSVRTGIETGLEREGASILGGDAEIELTYRFASEPERRWMEGAALAVSQIADFRSMATTGTGDDARRALTQVKSVDENYPLYGSVRLEPDMRLADALAGENGLPGAVVAPALAERLQLPVGGRFRLGGQQFVLTALLVREPDNVTGSFTLGPRTLVRTTDLAGSGLLSPGTLFETGYRLKLAPGVDLDALQAAARDAMKGGAFRWRDRRNGAPGIRDFVDHLAVFLSLVGLAGLAVGGVGISVAVRSFLEEKLPTIATLKAIGSDRSTIFMIYAFQIGAMAGLGIVLGLLLGASAPLALAPLIRARLPVPVDIGIHAGPLAVAAAYGVLAAALFALWPLARTERIRPATLFRSAATGIAGWPRWRYILSAGVILALLLGMAVIATGAPGLTLWAASGLFAAAFALGLAARGIRLLARLSSRRNLTRRLPAVLLGLRAVAGPGSEARVVVMSLGLGLSVLATIGQIDSNLRAAISRDLPDVAPLFFVVDIQPDQIARYRSLLEKDRDVEKLRTAPMLRGVITEINGRPAREVAGDHWVLAGDRGITYADRPPDQGKLVAGTWWPPGHEGPPQVSFAADEAEELGLKLGDRLTVNVLGRDIEAEITSLRDVDFSSAGMGFVLTMNPKALAGAPHSYISTIHAGKEAEGRLLRVLGEEFPNVTAISVREAIERVADILASISAALVYGALATLLTGAVVLIGVAAAGARGRAFEASVLKTLGATGGLVQMSFLFRSLILGAAAGAVAVSAGAGAAWAVMTFAMKSGYEFAPMSALVVIASGMLVNVVAGAVFLGRSLAEPPARILRDRQ